MLKKPKEPPFTIFGIEIFLNNFLSSKIFFLQFLKTLRFLSLIYSADFRRSSLVFTCRSEWRSSVFSLQCLRQSEVASVSERSLDQFIHNSQVLEAVIEMGIGHDNIQLLQWVSLFGIEIESHLHEPLEHLVRVHLFLHHQSSDVTLVHKFSDHVFQLLSSQLRLLQ